MMWSKAACCAFFPSMVCGDQATDRTVPLSGGTEAAADGEGDRKRKEHRNPYPEYQLHGDLLDDT